MPRDRERRNDEKDRSLKTRSRSPRDRDRNRNSGYDRRERDRSRDRYRKRSPTRSPSPDRRRRRRRHSSSSDSASPVDRRRRHSPPRSPSPVQAKSSRDEKIFDRRRKLSSSEGSTSSDEEIPELADFRKVDMERRQREKEKLKETETAEEKRVRRLAKKLQKEEKRKVLTYNNFSNPFNDPTLTDAFVWKKKLTSEGKDKLTKKEADEMYREKVLRNIDEMERLKREREARQRAREDDVMIARDRERQLGDYDVVELKFRIKQARERTKIRIREGRAKPIDLLARYSVFGMDAEEEASYGDFELVDPLTYLKGLSLEDFEDLAVDVKTFKRVAKHQDDNFWDDIGTIIEAEIAKLKDARRRAELDEGVHSSVKEDVTKIFKGKSYQELQKLEKDISAKLRNNENVAFWESLMEQLHPYMAKSRLRAKHAEKKAIKLDRIRQQQAKEMDEYQRQMGTDQRTVPVVVKDDPDAATEEKAAVVIDDEAAEIGGDDEIYPTTEEGRLLQLQTLKSIPWSVDEILQLDDDVREQKWSVLSDAQVNALAVSLYESGRYSPILGTETMPGIEVIDETEDAANLERERRKQRAAGGDGPEDTSHLTPAEASFRAAARRGMREDEEELVDEEKIETQTYLWSDKYRPRKPTYYNRVHTGFDWNKYNQTHYDLDNPPPKIVQGYRFNIFYPDLLDITQTPRFTLTKCEDPDFVVIRFKAGPPYEDIAFKIVNREWEDNHHNGFRNHFKDGVFQLWFSFKRYRYRR